MRSEIVLFIFWEIGSRCKFHLQLSYLRQCLRELLRHFARVRWACTHTHTHTQTHKHTNTQTHKHTNTHTNTHAHTHTRTNTHTCVHTRSAVEPCRPHLPRLLSTHEYQYRYMNLKAVWMHACIHAVIDPWYTSLKCLCHTNDTCSLTCTHTHMHDCMHAHAKIHTYMHTYVHTCIHKHETRIHTYVT